MLSLVVVVMFLLFLTSCDVSGFIVFSAGNCPRVDVKKDFDINAYTGTWYSYENFDAPYQFGMSCVTATYRILPDWSIQVVNEGYRDIRLFGISLNRRDVRADGGARVVNRTEPARLRVTFGAQPDFSIGQPQPNYMVIDTDYKTYSLVYSCSSLIIPFKLEGAWVLTRVRGARPPNIFELERKLASYGVKTKYFKMVDNSRC